MLPFLKDSKNKMITTLLDRRSGAQSEVEPVVESKENMNHNQDLESAVVKLLSGIEHKNVQDIRDALTSAFRCLDAESHVEGEHEEQD